MPDSHQNGFHHLASRDRVDEPELQAIDVLLTAAGERWQHIPLPTEHANQHLDAVVARAHANPVTGKREIVPSHFLPTSLQGERLIMKPTWRTTFIGVALTLCLITASLGVFVVLSHHQPGKTVASTPAASPTPHGPLAMPVALADLAMVSDHEGWALQNLADVTATPTRTQLGEQLWHLSNGTWKTVTIPGLAAPYTASLAMVAPTEGWLMATSWNNATPTYLVPSTTVVYHYDGSTWQQTKLPQLQGVGTPELDSIRASANGEAWITGNFVDTGGKKALQTTHVPMSALSCLPNCGHALVVHWQANTWTEVTVPSNVTIAVDNGSLGWFPGTETDQMTLYRYQSGSWAKLRLGIAATPTWIAMATPTDGWIGAYVPKHPGIDDGESIWVMYHFDGKTAQHIADVDFQQCIGATLAIANAITPDEIWVPVVSNQDCANEQQLWHLVGSTATTIALPAPYVAVGVPVQSDTSGNAWLLVSQKSGPVPGKSFGAVAPYDDKHEVILRWNGSAWVTFAQTPA